MARYFRSRGCFADLFAGFPLGARDGHVVEAVVVERFAFLERVFLIDRVFDQVVV